MSDSLRVSRIVAAWVSILGVLGALSLAAPAHAWSHGAHMTTGAIAYDDLARSDRDVLVELDRIIAAHPHIDRLSQYAEGIEGPERVRVLLQWLARWPDDIRDDPEFDCYECHYELQVVSGLTWLWPFRNGQASEAFSRHFAVLADTEASLRDRAIAVGWIAHIVGDIQQPLHAGHQLTWDFIGTDRAGLEAFVRRSAGEKATSLHEYWDYALDAKGEPVATVVKWARSLQTEIPRGAIKGLVYSGSIEQQFANWLDESMLLAGRGAYRGTALKAVPEGENAPVMTAWENHFTVALSKRRVVTGGYRIADVFRAAL